MQRALLLSSSFSAEAFDPPSPGELFFPTEMLPQLSLLQCLANDCPNVVVNAGPNHGEIVSKIVIIIFREEVSCFCCS